MLSRFDTPFRDDKFFYGVSVDFGPFLGGLEASLYAIEQRDRWLVDRQAVGTEFRYFDQTKSAFATVDYDVHFQQLNAAIFSGSWILPDKSTLYGGADYRRTPYLSTWNALLNQPFVTLYDMMRFQTLEQVQQLAVNQTPTYRSAMIGYSRPLNDHFQISADATVVNLSQPLVPAAADLGLPSLPAGNEYYYSTQFMGSNLFKDGDMYVTGLRYSQLLNSNMYVVDFNTRYPLSKELFLSPRLRVGYRAGPGHRSEGVHDAAIAAHRLLLDQGAQLRVRGRRATDLERAGRHQGQQRRALSDVRRPLRFLRRLRDQGHRQAQLRDAGRGRAVPVQQGRRRGQLRVAADADNLPLSFAGACAGGGVVMRVRSTARGRPGATVKVACDGGTIGRPF